ncbi:carboxypeptidase regulatory-like domain-containing protein [Massilia antarctica]|uniref:Carboxypeptidase regulatory-like domain-containing protein n=1 Tax=Massilia antarctica TaxID=2765360 RepID=A0AA49A8K8_9BURK|nr:carboxypeptidase-like regulatory domain-containing protein [Massilia antarctica]QPI49760.1 carboxypeptidase regulatory-like domain-containing protein [Massilia antarctica]
MSSKNNVKEARAGSLEVTVHEAQSGAPVSNATVGIYRLAPSDKGFDASTWTASAANLEALAVTGSAGEVTVANLAPGSYVVAYEHYPVVAPRLVQVDGGCRAVVCFQLALELKAELRFEAVDCHSTPCNAARVSDRAVAKICFSNNQNSALKPHVRVVSSSGWNVSEKDQYEFSRVVNYAGPQQFEAVLGFARRSLAVPAPGAVAAAAAGAVVVPASEMDLALAPPALIGIRQGFVADERTPSPISGNIGVSMTRTETEPTDDLPLWTLIRNSTDAMSFTNYLNFMDALFCTPGNRGPGFEAKSALFEQLRQRRALPFNDSEAYRVLKVATEAFVMVNCGVLSQPTHFNPVEDQAYLDRRDIPATRDLERTFNTDYLEETVDGTKVLPYLAIIRRKLPDVPIHLLRGQEGEADLCFGIVQQKLANPCLLELIWSYWHEEGMLVQTMNAITQRFQNVRALGRADPLANLEIDPLRPLNNLIWGYTQDEQHRLTVVRRNYEYDHHYGVRLDGKAVQHFRPADTRSKFLEAFHYLLRLCTSFYRQDDDTTVKADAFPVLNGLKEVHLILSQGAHNQFGDLPSTARIEMLMQQWMLARPEFREFLPTRIMVAYPEPWMDRVDAMKKLQGWSDTSVMHFRSLAMFGEQVLLSVRYGAWSDIYEPTQAFNWARFWRPQIQGYIHAYRAATGVDLTVDARDPKAEGTLPSILLRQRLDQQARMA